MVGGFRGDLRLNLLSKKLIRKNQRSGGGTPYLIYDLDKIPHSIFTCMTLTSVYLARGMIVANISKIKGT
jgi:hypothetical protein